MIKINRTSWLAGSLYARVHEAFYSLRRSQQLQQRRDNNRCHFIYSQSTLTHTHTRTLAYKRKLTHRRSRVCPQSLKTLLTVTIYLRSIVRLCVRVVRAVLLGRFWRHFPCCAKCSNNRYSAMLLLLGTTAVAIDFRPTSYSFTLHWLLAVGLLPLTRSGWITFEILSMDAIHSDKVAQIAKSKRSYNIALRSVCCVL